MFAIIISEKGGAERRESFDKNEINVGRVQGNDLMLPKGNVSKHHARLLYRDGRFIVTDLKSTNGTYVNGRKIAQATIVREGDKIYIGDFVLRLDSGAQSTDEPSNAQASPPPDDGGRSLQRTGPSNPGPSGNPGVGPGAPTNPPAGMPEATQGPIRAVNVPGMPPLPPDAAFAAGPPPPEPSHYPLERDPDDSGADTGEKQQQQNASQQPAPVQPPRLQVPAPPRVPTAVSPGASPGAPRMGSVPTPARPISPPRAGSVPPPARSPSPGQSSGQDVSSARSSSSRQPPRESAASAARRLALVTLVDRVADATDLQALRSSLVVDEQTASRIDRVVRDQAGSMMNEGEAPEGTDVEQLMRDAIRELVGLGPIGMLLEEDDVTEIQCLRHDNLLVTRAGSVGPADTSFTSEDAFSRIIGRLTLQAGEPVRQGEFVIERRLPRGAHMLAFVPPASAGHALLIRKRRRLNMSLEDFVRLGGLSRAMATFLENCIAAKANVLISGANGQALSSYLAALTAACGPGDRVAVVQEVDEITVPHAHVVSIALADTDRLGEEAVRAAAKVRADRLVVSSLAGRVGAATLEAVADGAEGVLAATTAPSLRQGLSRLVAQLLLTRPGMSVEAARECVGEAFDIAMEVAPLSDGRHRVIRLAELGGADAKGVVVRDLFTAGEGDGAFVSTGVVPRVVGEFAQRGVKVDPNLFKRSVGR
jgi:pilus assembly protein CpaF